MDRVSVVGTSGSGKTTFARRLGDALGVPVLELDSAFHLPGWTPRDPVSFRRIVAGFVGGDRWVVDGNYSTVRDLVWARADTVVWLDYPRWRVMARIVPRTLRRMILRRPLWNDNREELRSLLSNDPEQNVILWAWTTHGARQERYGAAMVDPGWAHLEFHRLRTPGQAERLISHAGVGR